MSEGWELLVYIGQHMWHYGLSKLKVSFVATEINYNHSYCAVKILTIVIHTFLLKNADNNKVIVFSKFLEQYSLKYVNRKHLSSFYGRTKPFKVKSYNFDWIDMYIFATVISVIFKKLMMHRDFSWYSDGVIKNLWFQFGTSFDLWKLLLMEREWSKVKTPRYSFGDIREG